MRRSNNITYIRSCKFGIDNEKKFFPYIRKHIADNLQKSTDRYDTFDFYNSDTLVELKSRTCRSDRYPTTMVGFNKVERALNEEKKCFFVFAFTDGLYSWEFDKDDSSAYEVRSDMPNSSKPYAYIPIAKLKCLESF